MLVTLSFNPCLQYIADDMLYVNNWYSIGTLKTTIKRRSRRVHMVSVAKMSMVNSLLCVCNTLFIKEFGAHVTWNNASHCNNTVGLMQPPCGCMLSMGHHTKHILLWFNKTMISKMCYILLTCSINVYQCEDIWALV